MASSPLSETRAALLNISHAEKMIDSSQVKTEMSSEAATNFLHVKTSSISQNVTHDPENIAPMRHAKHLAQTSLDTDLTSPTKLQSNRQSPSSANFELSRSPRKFSSPDRRFPVKPYSPQRHSSTIQSPSIEDVLRDNEGITKAIEILEGKGSDTEDEKCSDDTLLSKGGSPGADNDHSNLDDTITSTFSSFSAIPDMTTFSELRQNTIRNIDASVAMRSQMTPATYRRSLVLPFYDRNNDDGNTTNLLEFTADVEKYTNNPSPAKLARQSVLHNKKLLDMTLSSSPSVKRHTITNLLDFDIPPAPTPRSLPTITPRELESLKSGFLSEISSLKASLSGKEAEVFSLKSAVADAEKRVGESLEQLREEQGQRQQLSADKDEWEKSWREMENMDREELEGRLAESDARRHAAELMAQEAETRVAKLRAGRCSPESENKSQAISEDKMTEIAVERVSKELHARYKEKHEEKVASLKKSYERRWDRKVNELEKRVEELVKENERLKSEQDTKSDDVASALLDKINQNLAKIEELEVKVESTQNENTELQNFLSNERLEKDKLIQTVEEMLPLISSFDELLVNMEKTQCSQQMKPPTPSNDPAPSVENLRGSISKSSGIRAPMCHANIGESRIGRGGFGLPATKESRARSTSTMSRPLSGFACKSGIMSSIERMGSHKGRGKC
ncbi:hypothetical protein Golomagni_01985 [Golovinomyces magnicellulatus]|nr:hypothetical protein Golomagni_01985 [Golovinomyces magnicellulatus]